MLAEICPHCCQVAPWHFLVTLTQLNKKLFFHNFRTNFHCKSVWLLLECHLESQSILVFLCNLETISHSDLNSI